MSRQIGVRQQIARPVSEFTQCGREYCPIVRRLSVPCQSPQMFFYVFAVAGSQKVIGKTHPKRVVSVDRCARQSEKQAHPLRHATQEPTTAHIWKETDG